MKASTLTIALGAAPAVVAAGARPRCLIDDDNADSPLDLIRRQEGTVATANTTIPTEMAVDVHFHIVSTAAEQDLITDAIADAQWSLLHDTYAQYNISLTLQSTSRVVDELAGAGWLVFDPSTSSWNNYPTEKAAFFNATRRGGYDALNLYFFAPWLPGASGFCTFPTAAMPREDEEAFYTDACQVSALTMPGVPAENATLDGYTLGHVAVHETGHWFGLNHTFAGGCREPGDFVADTPATGVVYDCPVGSDTCPGVEGLDPIHNFMSYTNDSCTHEFTEGQQQRMFETFFSYRRNTAA